MIGVGHLGRHHARIASQSSASLAGVYDADSERTHEIAAGLGVTPFSTVEDLLAQCEAVIVATPAASHFSVAKAALEAGKHCLVEKPLVAESSAAQTLVQLASARGLVLAVGHSERFNPAVEKADTFVHDPLYIEATRVAPFPGRGMDVDVVKDLMVHDLEIVLHWVGSYPIEMRAVGVALVTDKIDMANVRLEFSGGQVATLTASRASPSPLRVIRVFQRGGYVSADLGSKKLRIVRQTPQGLSVDESIADGPEPLRAELEDFLTAVRTARAPRVSGREGAEVLRLAEAIVDHIAVRLRRLQPPR